MCGIAGYRLTSTKRHNGHVIVNGLRAMSHRGPDDEGLTLIDPGRDARLDMFTAESQAGLRDLQRYEDAAPFEHTVGFGHRRFSIVDLSLGGHQPFWAGDGRVCVSFNGEIYNYVEVREELRALGHDFRTTSDTEVLAVSYLEWGEGCFSRLNGFWAVSLYDARRRQVLLTRDRLGHAPCYVVQTDDGVYWASEINGLFAMLGRDRFSVNERAAFDFIRHQRRDFFHETCFREIHTLPAGSYAWIEADGTMEPKCFWSPPSVRLTEEDISIEEAAREVRDLLDESVRIRLRADVNVAVQVSGGLDSSSLLALGTHHQARIDAYSVAFSEPEANEEHYARMVADMYSDVVSYHVLEPPDDELVSQLDGFVNEITEPFHSPNVSTTRGVWTRMAQDDIRAALYGAAGDEVFAGYTREYFVAYLRDLLGGGQLRTFWSNFSGFSERTAGRLGVDYFLRAAVVAGGVGAYESLVERVRRRDDPVLWRKDVPPTPALSGSAEERILETLTDWKMNYWLRLDNQNSMTVPIELRLPFLDYHVIDFAFSLPFSYLIRDGWKKWILRKAMHGLLPDEVLWRRRKMGFPFPLQSWLGRHREHFLAVIGPLNCPFVDTAKLASAYERLRARNPNYLWCVISTALWWKRCVEGNSLARPA